MSYKNWGFCDLSVSTSYDFDKLDLYEKFGFQTVAINTHVEEPSNEPKKKKKKGENTERKDCIPLPPEIPAALNKDSKLNILHRVTIEFSDSGVAHKFNQSDNLKKYDIVAVIPKTLQAFQYACATLDADIITFNPETRLPYKVSRKLYRQAAERGLFFEIMYSPAIKDSSARKNIISTAHNYHAVGRSKNIILTSGAENSMQVRDVHDVINLAFIMGLNSNQGLEAIRNNARRLILKGEGRKCGKFFMTVGCIESGVNKTSEQ